MLNRAGGYIRFEEETREEVILQVCLEFASECLEKELFTRICANILKQDLEFIGVMHGSNVVPFGFSDSHLSEHVDFLFRPGEFTLAVDGRNLTRKRDLHEKMIGLQEIFQKTFDYQCVQSVQFVATGDASGVPQFSQTVQVNRLAAFLIGSLESSNFAGEFDLTIIK